MTAKTKSRPPLLGCVSMLVIALAVHAKAVPLAIDSGWTILQSPQSVPLPTTGSPYVFDGGPWEMTSATPVKLTVTDLYVPGDLFEVWNNGAFLGSGSTPNGLYSFASTPDQALGNLRFIQGSWLLQPGSYSLLFKSTKFAPTYSNTSLAFKAERVNVPDGGITLLLLGMAFAGVAGMSRTFPLRMAQ